MSQYHRTHRFIQVKRSSAWPEGCPVIRDCREMLGDNRITQPLHERPWFTAADGVWIRHDCLDNSLATWLVLKNP
jgi:hypothetical protein